jgi:hypothetical protein
MTIRPRPVIAVRLIGPADVVATHKAHLIYHFQTLYGPAVICRTSTRRASYAGECRTYLTVILKEHTLEPLQRNGNSPASRMEDTR